MALKGMETSIVIIVASVVILITALVVISVFSGGLGTFQNIFNPWAENTGLAARCQAQCSTSCAIAPQGTIKPNGYPPECSSIPCDCRNLAGQNCAATGQSCQLKSCCPDTGGCDTTTKICK